MIGCVRYLRFDRMGGGRGEHCVVRPVRRWRNAYSIQGRRFRGIENVRVCVCVNGGKKRSRRGRGETKTNAFENARASAAAVGDRK